MSLTLGDGPLASNTPAGFNFSLDDAPRHRVFFEADPRRLRATIDGRVVLDSARVHTLHESNILPVAYVPIEDVDPEVLERHEGHSTHCPFKGDASYWHVAGREDALWGYEDPLPEAAWLKGFVALDSAKVDAWFVEDDLVFAHLKDRYHRCDVHASTRAVEVRVAGEVVARSSHPLLLFETGLPPRVYVPPADVEQRRLVASETTALCPYKGRSSYWSVRAGAGVVGDAVWGYPAPLPDALRVQGHLAFDDSLDEVEIVLSEPQNRFSLHDGA